MRENKAVRCKTSGRNEEEKLGFSPEKWQHREAQLLVPSTHSPFKAARFSSFNTPSKPGGFEEAPDLRPRMLNFGAEAAKADLACDSLLSMYNSGHP